MAEGIVSLDANPLRITLFGGLQLAMGDRAFVLRALPRCTELLAYLLLQPPQPRDALAFALWPDVDESTARANLRRHLYELRRSLPQPGSWIVSKGGRLGWNPDAPTWLDVAAFEAALRAGRDDEAIAHYGGELLPYAEGDWLLFERERLHQLQLAALARQTARLLAAAQWGRALDLLLQWRRLDPLSESALQREMLTRAALGGRPHALAAYERFAELLTDELNTRPQPETQRLRQQIADEAPLDSLQALLALGDTTGAAAAPTNLPARMHPLVGRDGDLAALSERLQDTAVRMITLVGPSGVGKTRLALAAARRQQPSDRFADGVFLTPLASLTAAAQLLPAIADVLNVRLGAAEQMQANLITALRYRRLLLVLDNFEHIIDAAAQLAGLLAAIPGLTLLVTSQTPLDLTAEYVYPLHPLATPDAVRLFVDRAQASDARLTPTAVDERLIHQICARLDNLPLAIELAAARTRQIPLPQLATQLQHDYGLLVNQARDAAPRHRTLTTALQWSYDLLQSDEQALFRRLSIFVDGFTPAAVATVCYQQPPRDPAAIDYAVLEPLLALSERHLCRSAAVQPVEGELRFEQLVTIRHFARAQLVDVELLTRRHLHYYAWLAQQAQPVLADTAPAVWLARLQAEEGNLRQALRSALHDNATAAAVEQGVAIILGMYTYWRWYARIREARQWCERALQLRDRLGEGLTIRLLQDAGIWSQRDGDFDDAYRHLQQALALARRLEESEPLAQTLHTFSIVAGRNGDLALARALVAESIQIERQQHGDAMTPTRASATLNLAAILLRSGDDAPIDDATVRRCEHFLRDYGSDMTLYLLNLAEIARRSGDASRAMAYIREGLQLALSRDNRYAQLIYLPTLAEWAFAAGAGDSAARLFSAFRHLCEQMQVGWPPSYVQRYQQGIDRLRARLDARTLAAHVAAGAGWSLTQALRHVTDSAWFSGEK